jgi:hypothetical protein
MNIYPAVYCRRLNASLRIVSRVTHERNVEAIHRAGADFALSYTTLGAEAVMSLLRGGESVVLEEARCCSCSPASSSDESSPRCSRRLVDSAVRWLRPR